MVRLHESGAASRTLSRRSSGSCTEPPVESWTTRSVPSRSAVTVSRQPAEVEGRPVLAVADVHVDHRGAGRLALLGGGDQLLEGGRELGQSSLAVSAPVGATVISSGSVMARMLPDL